MKSQKGLDRRSFLTAASAGVLAGCVSPTVYVPSEERLYGMLLHLGYDEEVYDHQSGYLHCVIRQGDLWWHDFLYIVQEVERYNGRAWVWSDKIAPERMKGLMMAPWAGTAAEKRSFFDQAFDLMPPAKQALDAWPKI